MTGSQLTVLPSIADQIEEHFGSGFDAASRFPLSDVLAADRQATVWREQIDWLNQLGLHRHYVPVELGGDMRQLLSPWRAAYGVSRRDIGLSITHGISLLPALQLWCNGTPTQQSVIANTILEKRKVAICVTERGKGSDLLRTQVAAGQLTEGWGLNGEKYLINGAGDAATAIVLARDQSVKTDNPHDGLMLTLCNLDAARQGGRSSWQRIPLSIVRTADIGSLQLVDARFCENDIIARGRTGLTSLLEGFEYSKIMLAGLALGAFDTALRIAMTESTERMIYGGALNSLPLVKHILAKSLLCFIGGQSLACLALAGAHATPHLLWNRSNALKAYCGIVEKTVHELSGIFGSASFVQNNHFTAVIEKISRDMAFPRQVHGHHAVCLYHLAQGMRNCRLDQFSTGDVTEAESLASQLSELGSISLANFGKVKLRPRLEDEVFLLARMNLKSAGRKSNPQLLDASTKLTIAIGEWSQKVADVPRGKSFSLQEYQLMSDYCNLLAAAALISLAKIGVIDKTIGLDGGLVSDAFCDMFLGKPIDLIERNTNLLVEWLETRRQWQSSMRFV